MSEGRSVREIELMWIPMPDGTRLAARVILPDDAEAHPVPAILEYIPYRRRDATRDGDNLTQPARVVRHVRFTGGGVGVAVSFADPTVHGDRIRRVVFETERRRRRPR